MTVVKSFSLRKDKCVVKKEMRFEMLFIFIVYVNSFSRAQCCLCIVPVQTPRTSVGNAVRSVRLSYTM